MSDYFLADDLSGALDAAAGFHATGRRVRIVWTTEDWGAAPADAVVGFTTETRNAAPASAASAVTRVLEHGKRRGARLRYKKIDSTLRGPVAAELAAVLEALPDVRVLFTPANPRVGRTVREGVLLVNGVPVAQTEFGRDPANPVLESAIAALLGDSAGPRVTIADVESEYDLASAVSRMRTGGGNWIGVGSGALARPVAAAHAAPIPSSDAARPRPPARGPRLMIAGSAHPANRAHAAALARAHGVPTCEVPVSDPGAAVVAAIAAIRAGGSAALMLASERTSPERALAAITHAAGEVIGSAGVSRFFVTGGETAFALCRHLRVSFLDFAAELEPGLSMSFGECAGRRLVLAIKPGGFGDTQTWIRAWRALDGI